MGRAANRACAAPLLALLLTWSAAAQEDPPPPPPPDPPPAPDSDGDGVIDAREKSGDTDADGTPDVLDTDDDGDGLRTRYEYVHPTRGPDPELTPATQVFLDSDGDGTPDFLEYDDDGDGLATPSELPDPNQDGNPADARVTAESPDSAIPVPDYRNADDDSDGILTTVERPNNQDRDSDGDGRPDHRDDDDDDDTVLREDDLDTDADSLLDYRDPDDDGDGVLSRNEVGVTPRDTDQDGILDNLDPDDDGDGALTRDELGAGGGASPRDTDADGKADFVDADDDGDGLASQAERTRGDTDADGLADPIDDDDDGDALATLLERAFVSDVDGDGTPNWYDLDSDGDGFTDLEEGADDDDGDGVPNFVDPRDSGGPSDPGTIADAGTGGIGSGGNSDAGAPGLETSRSDGGCQASARSRGGAWLGILLIALALASRRRRSAALAVALIFTTACSDDNDDAIGLGDGGLPRMDAGITPILDAGMSVPIDASDLPALASACTVEGDTLTQPIEEPAERAFSAELVGDTLHLAFVTRTCGGVGVASGTRIDHLAFRSTGALGAVETIATDPDGLCAVRRSPALAVNANGVVDAYFTAVAEGANELYRRELTSGATPQRVTTDVPGAARDELSTVASTFGDAPLLAYVKQTSLAAPSQLVTRRQGQADVEIVAVAEAQRPERIALAALAGGGGVIGWVSEQAGGSTLRIRALDLAGAPRAAAVELATQVGALSTVGLARNGDVGAVIYVVQSANVGELRHKRLDAQGQPGATESRLTTASKSVTGASITAYGRGFVVAYRDVPLAAEATAALQLMFIADDGKIGGERKVADVPSSGGASRVLLFPDGRLAVAWVDYGASGATLRAVRVRCF